MATGSAAWTDIDRKASAHTRDRYFMPRSFAENPALAKPRGTLHFGGHQFTGESKCSNGAY
jgi:hypothetical protein